MMVKLQRSFSSGTGEDAPVDSIELRAHLPVFGYETVDDQFQRHQVGDETIDVEQALSADHYSISGGATSVIGADADARLGFLRCYLKAFTEGPLGSLAFDVPVEFRVGSMAVGSTTVRALPLVLGTSRGLLGTLTERGTGDNAGALREVQDPGPALERAVVLANAERYDELARDLVARVGHDESLLAILVVRFVDLAGVDPTVELEFSDDQRMLLRRAITVAGLDPTDQLVEWTEKALIELFDFPLAAPELHALEIAGDFEVRSPGGPPLTPDVLRLYELAAEYLPVDGSPSVRYTYNWELTVGEIAGTSVPFNFDEAKAILLGDRPGTVVVTAKSFDGVVQWNGTFAADARELGTLKVAVDRIDPARLTPGGGPTDTGKRLRGRVVELVKDCPVKDVTVVIQAKESDDGIWIVVGAATTDSSGNFSLPYPSGAYVKAQALTSLTPNDPADVVVHPDKAPNSISDDFLYLLVTDPTCPHDSGEECDCHKGGTAGRLPDQADLIGSGDYSQDLGGSCVNLSVPNRTLAEYAYQGIVRTSDPDIANYTLVKDVEQGTFELQGGAATQLRDAVSLANPIRWQDAPGAHHNLSLYQAVTVATGHILHYKAVFKADGYSMGDLLYSLALAPGQKREIVQIDSAHSLQGTEVQSIGQAESLSASLVNERGVLDQVSGNIGEALRGSSSASTSGVSAGLGAGFSYGGFGASLGVAGGYSNSNSNASQDSSRNTAMYFGEQLRQAIMQNAHSYRQLNATVITTVQEGQKYDVTTDVVANHNHCHALTMMYFEVLRHFAIFQELESVEECLFVPLLMTEFTSKNIYKWADVLAQHLLPLPANTYLQPIPYLRYRAKHPLIPAFDANARIENNYKFVDFPAGAYCDEPITSVSGSFNLRVEIPRPKSFWDRVLSFPIVNITEAKNNHPGGVVGFFADLLLGDDVTYTTHEERQKFADSHIVIYDNLNEARPADVIEVISFKNFFSAGSHDDKLWTAFANLLGYTDVEAFLANFFSHKTISQWDATYNDEIAPLIFDALTKDSLTLTPFTGLDTTPTSRYHGGQRLIRVNFTADTSKTRRDITSVGVVYFKTITNPDAFWAFATFNLEGLSIHYTTKHFDGAILNTSVGDDLRDDNPPTGHVIPTPMNSAEQRDPHDEDRYLVRKLMEHLNSNIEYYNKVLWTRLDPDRRFMLLDGFKITVYNDFGVAQPPRSLASVVKNQLLGIAGNSLIFPVAAGYRVSQSYLAEVNDAGETEHVSLLDHYQPMEPVPPYRISVPSQGVFLEAVQGVCDACERVKENSSQDWDRFRTDEPTAVLPVTTPVPTVTDWKAAFEQFATPMVNIQNAPALPTPGEGLTGITELLGKAGIFKDITGLDANQQNAIRTYLSNQENAKAFAEMAKGMATQAHNTEHSDKIMETLDSAKAKGALSDSEYGSLVKAHAQQQIDGGASAKATADRDERKASPSPIASAVKLSQDGASSVKASESDAEGNVKSLEVTPPASGSAAKYDVKIPGAIEPMQQETDLACWATVATMMANWRDQVSRAVREYITSVGAEYLPYIDTGLPLDQVMPFADAAGMQYDGPNAEYPVSHYVDVLKRYGPIWINDLESTDVTLLHGRLVTGVHGGDTGSDTTFSIVDPATGTAYDEDFPTFMAKMEGVAETLKALPNAVVPLLIYFKYPYDPTKFGAAASSGSAGGSGSGGGTIGGTTNQQRVRDFVPAAEDTLVVDGAELGAVAGMTNWFGMYKKADGTFDTAARDADRSFNDSLHPGTKKYAGGGYRPATGLNKIALHETAGWNDYLKVADWRVDVYPSPPQTPTSTYKAMPHFVVNRDGSIRQFFDVCELTNHLGSLNSTSIGIEFVNDLWGTAGQHDFMLQDGTQKHGVDPIVVPAISGLPSLNRKGKDLCLYLPTKAQLEGLVTLVRALLTAAPLSQIEHTWLNEINVNPKNIKTQTLDDLHAYWILNTGWTQMADPTLSGINGSISQSGWTRAAPGLITHLLVGGHSDGLIQGLYTWLRIDQNMSADDAMATMTDVLTKSALRLSGGSGLALMELTKLVYQIA